MRFIEIAAERVNTLYVSRPLSTQSANDLRRWAKLNGFDKTLEPIDMHVTVAFSRTPVQWNLIKPDVKKITVPNSNRSIMPLGDKGAVVLTLHSDDLTNRWHEFIDMGCSWDYDDYVPHVTISYNGPTTIPKITAYDKPIELAAEKWNPVKMDWEIKFEES
jgi:2'-5' RNA ligase